MSEETGPGTRYEALGLRCRLGLVQVGDAGSVGLSEEEARPGAAMRHCVCMSEEEARPGAGMKHWVNRSV